VIQLQEYYDFIRNDAIPVSVACQRLVDFIMSKPVDLRRPSFSSSSSSPLIKSKSEQRLFFSGKEDRKTSSHSRSAPVSPNSSYTTLPVNDFSSRVRTLLNSSKNAQEEPDEKADSSSDSDYYISGSSPAPLATCWTREESAFETTPVEILCLIFSWLDSSSLVYSHSVCKRWKNIIEEQPQNHPLHRWDWLKSLYEHKLRVMRSFGDPLVTDYYCGSNPFVTNKLRKSSSLQNLFKQKSDKEELKTSKGIDKELELHKDVQDSVINLVLMGDDNSKTLFCQTLQQFCGDIHEHLTPGVREYFMWMQTKNKTPIRIVDMGELQNAPIRSRKKWYPYFEDSLAVVICLNIGDYDAVYQESKDGGYALVYHHYYRLIKDTLHSKFFNSKPVILVLYKGDFDQKVSTALKNGTGDDLGLLFPDYRAREDPSRQAEYFANRIVQWINSKRRVRCISKCFSSEDDASLISMLHDTVRHCVIQRRAYKLGLGAI